MPPSEPTKLCPYCRERIPVAATKCRYCRKILPEQGEEEAGSRPPQSTAIQENPPHAEPLQALPVDENEEEAYEEERLRRRKRGARPGPFADCPNCSSPGHADKVSFTWWGGLVGPAIFNHVRCRDCGTCYNGRTGNYNTTGIAIYLSIGGVATLVILAVIILISLNVK